MQIYISSIGPYRNLAGIELVTRARRERIRGYVQLADKARCLVAGLLLRRVCGVRADCQLAYGENGKPYLKSGDMYFNVSHAGDYVVLAVANSEVGVDIERVSAYSDAVADRCFTPPEREWLRQEGSDEAFYRLWTAKESAMKASGFGFALQPESFSVLPLDSSAHSIACKPWFFEWISFSSYILCSATGNEGDKAEVIAIAPGDLVCGCL